MAAVPLKTVSALEPDPKGVTVLQKAMGGLCLGVFVATWILSIASPFIFVWSVMREYYVVATAVALITVVAYLPWKKGWLANAFTNWIATYTPCYFKSIAMVFEGEQLPTATDQPQTFYAIHPHSAFCIGWAMLFCHPVMQHVRFCFAPALYLSPFFRLFARCTGNPGSAAKFAMVKLEVW